MLLRGFRFKLDPTPAQAAWFCQFSGVCRLIYNLALEQRRDWWRHYERETGSRLNYVAQARQLTALRAEFDWIAAVSQTCQQQALRDLDRAYQNFFNGRARYPTPRKKGINDAFRFQGREVTLHRLNRRWSTVRLPKIGEVRFRDTRPICGEIQNATVTLEANGWHIVFACQIEHSAVPSSLPPVGIDRGVANTLALSTGELLSLPPTLEKIERAKRRAQRVMTRRKRGSRRHAKQRRRVAALQARAGRIRSDWLHKASHMVATRFGTVVLEDLAIKNMTASAKGTVEEPGRKVRQKAGLNRAILSQGWGRFDILLAYKLAERGGTLVKVPAAYTSQTCPSCGQIDAASRKSQAVFRCVACGQQAHADVNAAINILRRNAASMLVESSHQRLREARTRKVTA